MAILDLMSQITKTFQNKKYYIAKFSDLSKAFDFVDHDSFLENLKAYRFDPRCWDTIL